MGLLAAKKRNNGILGERGRRGKDELHNNIFIPLPNIMMHPKLLSKG